MALLTSLKERVLKFIHKDTKPSIAYDLWAKDYDVQPDNLMLALDEQFFSSLLSRISISDKSVIDIGCGTGRHWQKLFDQSPKEIVGYDVSLGMLNVLKEKYPEANLVLIKDEQLQLTADKSCDVLITTLALAHIKDLSIAFKEWDRVLANNSDILITDYHPETLAAGGNRTFTNNGKTISIINYVHPIQKIKEIALVYGFEALSFIEKRIDHSVRDAYAKQNALHVYERFKGSAIIYGMHLKRSDGTK